MSEGQREECERRMWLQLLTVVYHLITLVLLRILDTQKVMILLQVEIRLLEAKGRLRLTYTTIDNEKCILRFSLAMSYNYNLMSKRFAANDSSQQFSRHLGLLEPLKCLGELDFELSVHYLNRWQALQSNFQTNVNVI